MITTTSRIAICCALAACDFNPRSSSIDADVSTDAPEIIDASPDADTLTVGLVAWYEMESLANNTAIDSSGNDHVGTCTSCPVVVPGIRGMAFDFDGLQRVDVANTPALRTASAFSVAMWINFDTLPGGMSFACGGGKGQIETFSNSWQLCYQANGQDWVFLSRNTTALDFLPATDGPTQGTWYHVVLVWDGAMKQLWIDGMLEAERAQPVVVFDDNPVTLGADIDGGNFSAPMDGKLDDVRIYNRVLSPAEITRLATR